MWQSAQMQMLAQQEAIKEEAEARKDERRRAAAASVAAGEAATDAFLRQRRGEPVGRTLNQVLSDAAATEDPFEVEFRRCRSELDRWLQDGGTFGRLRELLGTVATARRSAMADSQTRMRARYVHAEAATSTYALSLHDALLLGDLRDRGA